MKTGNTVNLMAAFSQWASRPADERFGSLDAMHRATLQFKNAATSAIVDLDDILTVADGDELRVYEKGGDVKASMSNWAFGQLCRRAKAPASFLATLPAHIAADALNNSLARTAGIGVVLDAENADEDGTVAKMLFTQEDDRLTLRSLTGVGYARVWNHEIVAQLRGLGDDGWKVPPARPSGADMPGARPATEDDLLDVRMGSLSISVGDMIAPAGLYASDHDMFAFMVNENNRLDDGSDGGLSRGFFVSNSEVGAAAFKLTTYLYRNVCGNHIVWGAENAHTISYRHVGDADIRIRDAIGPLLTQYVNASAADDEARIKRLKTIELGKTPATVVDALRSMRIPGLGLKTSAAAYASTDTLGGIDGNPRTAWGIANGLTRISQREDFAESRTVLDTAAGKVLEVAGA